MRQRVQRNLHSRKGHQTGRFPVVSSKGNKYIMILYDYDSNAILAQPIKDRTSPELLRAFQVMEQEVVARGLNPKLMKLDNEASKLLKTYLHQQNITFQLVPPYSHRRNSAERAIRSFKDHLIAGICSTDKSFPMHLWDRLLPQAVFTLNMLRTSRINPKLSAATHMYGQYDFNRAPMAPPGTRIIAHETPNRRQTWAPHGQDGGYIGPALEHYRCYMVYITKARGERVVETVEFPPEKFKLPFPSAQDLATKAAAELTHALLHPQPHMDTKTKTWALLKSHLKAADRDIHSEATSGVVGYHGTPYAAPNSAATREADLLARLTANEHALARAMSTAPTASITQTVDTVANMVAITSDPPRVYCWTHGFCKNISHTSAACLYPGEGHQVAATATNMRRGTTTNVLPNSRAGSSRASCGS
jgi:hypothetical protein